MTRSRPGRLTVGLAAQGRVRWLATELGGVVEESRRRLDLSPLAATAFGRATAAAAMLLRLNNKTPRRLSVDLRGNGVLGRVLVEVSHDGDVRGMVGRARACGDGGPSDLGVGAALGTGLLTVTRHEQDGRVYESRTILVTGEVGDDLAHHLDQSEQRRSAVLLGVYVSSDGVETAGGMIVEALPHAPDAIINRLEQAVRSTGSVGEGLHEHGLEMWIDGVLRGFEPVALEQLELRYRCRCRREQLRQQLGSIAGDQLADLADSSGVVVAECAFCGEFHRFELSELAAQAIN